MANTVTLKRSSVEGKVPEVSDLAYGEVALNFTDGRLYYRNSADEIEFFEKSAQTSEFKKFFENDNDLGFVSEPVESDIELGLVSDSAVDFYDLGAVVGKFVLQNVKVSEVPSGASGQIVFVTDEAGGPTIAFFDGSDWRRTTDNQVIST